MYLSLISDTRLNFPSVPRIRDIIDVFPDSVPFPPCMPMNCFSVYYNTWHKQQPSLSDMTRNFQTTPIVLYSFFVICSSRQSALNPSSQSLKFHCHTCWHFTAGFDYTHDDKIYLISYFYGDSTWQKCALVVCMVIRSGYKAFAKGKRPTFLFLCFFKSHSGNGFV